MNIFGGTFFYPPQHSPFLHIQKNKTKKKKTVEIFELAIIILNFMNINSNDLDFQSTDRRFTCQVTEKI